MANILIHDSRVPGRSPDGFDKICHTHAETDLYSLLVETADWMRNHAPSGTSGWQNALTILGHGLPVGLQVGSLPLHQNNLSFFLPLRGLVSIIYVRGCSAASSYPGRPYNGTLFCSGLARLIHASVMASDSTQFTRVPSFNSTSENLALTRWQGNVGVWNSRGILERVDRYGHNIASN